MDDIILTDRQKEILEATLPFGILARKYIFGDSEDETARSRDICRRMKEKGFIEKYEIPGTGSRPTSREVLTYNGILAISEILRLENVDRRISAERKSHVDSGIDSFYRKVRMADVQLFLRSAGCETPYSAFKMGMSPFLFNFPQVPERVRNHSIYGLITQYMLDSLNERQDEVAKVSDSRIKRYFLPSCYCKIGGAGKEKASEKSKSQRPEINAKFYNNSVGVLFDFEHEESYIVFKELNSRSQSARWFTQAYKRVVTLNRSVLPNETQPMALLLFNSKRDFEKKSDVLLNSRKGFPEPFSHAFAFVADQNGLEQVKNLLGAGACCYLNEQFQITAEKTKMAMKHFISAAGTESYYDEKGTTRVYNGTICDYALIKRIMREINDFNKFKEYPDFHRNTYKAVRLICRSEQAEFYSEIAKIPIDNLLILDITDSSIK